MISTKPGQIARSSRRIWAALASLSMLTIAPAFAQSLYKWVDAQGNVTYQDTPPKNVEYEEQALVTGEEASASDGNVQASQALSNAVSNSPVVLYAIADCDNCDLVRLYLQRHAIPFTEKDASVDLDAQQELMELVGQLRVPAIAIGDMVVDGYSRSALRDALQQQGYPMAELESAQDEDTSEIAGGQNDADPALEISPTPDDQQ